MTRSDHQLETEPSEPGDPLSATGMFLNAFRQQPGQHEGQPAVAMDAVPVDSLPFSASRSPEMDRPSASSMPSGPSEFTRLFQNTQAPLATGNAEPQGASMPAAGDFTRIFVPPPSATLETPRIERESSLVAVPVSKPARGFSSPGVSDSAVAEGDFTQLFRSASRPQASAADLPVFTPPASATPPNADSASTEGFTQIFREMPSAPSYSSHSPVNTRIEAPNPSDSPPQSPLPGAGQWQPPTRFEEGNQPADSTGRSESATDMFSKVASNNHAQPEPQTQFDNVPLSSQPSAFTPSPRPPAYSPVESGSLTQLIDMLSPVAPKATPASWSRPSPAPVDQPWAAGPSEFTTIISGDQIKASAQPFVMPAAPAPAKSGAAPAYPHAGAAPGSAFPNTALPNAAFPGIAPPPVAIPKPDAHAGTPMSKLQRYLPILLVLNAFLMLVLIVVIIFSLRQR